MRRLGSARQDPDQIFGSSEMFQTGWSWFKESVGISKSDAFKKSGLVDQINTTADSSDYLWYSIRYADIYIFRNVIIVGCSLAPQKSLSYEIICGSSFFGSFEIRGDEPYLINGSQTFLHVESLGHVLHTFINGQLSGDLSKGNVGIKKGILLYYDSLG
ncbi:Beta-galactosidase 8 [Asimina triloba]